MGLPKRRPSKNGHVRSRHGAREGECEACPRTEGRNPGSVRGAAARSETTWAASKRMRIVSASAAEALEERPGPLWRGDDPQIRSPSTGARPRGAPTAGLVPHTDTVRAGDPRFPS